MDAGFDLGPGAWVFEHLVKHALELDGEPSREFGIFLEVLERRVVDVRFGLGRELQPHAQPAEAR
ncbi:hypothetical protein DB30_06148 [Enhygromyxa salina]|uniref:Uncharacterized protein n=1 Tax=Enhygromyxa salina TaxID=215803 RepID=A0A0C1ZB91_9BACT|nr:hypothetical protein DB30_06148 [Enhygromyxa salina]